MIECFRHRFGAIPAKKLRSAREQSVPREESSKYSKGRAKAQTSVSQNRYYQGKKQNLMGF